MGQQKETQLIEYIINSILEAEMDEFLGSEKYKHMEGKNVNYRNGHFKKVLRSRFGDVKIEVPRDRNTEFKPIIVPKYTRDIFKLEKRIIELCDGNNIKRSITRFVKSVYGANVSKNLLNNIIDRILSVVERWKFSR